MLQRRIASRYAEALFGLAQQQGKTEIWERELASLGALLASPPELYQVLTHPEIPLRRKETVLKRAFQGKIAEEILAVLLMLIRRGHEPDIDTIHDIYRQLWNQARRVIPVTVTSAVPLSDAQAHDTGADTGAAHRRHHPARARTSIPNYRRHGGDHRRSCGGCQRADHPAGVARGHGRGGA